MIRPEPCLDVAVDQQVNTCKSASKALNIKKSQSTVGDLVKQIPFEQCLKMFVADIKSSRTVPKTWTDRLEASVAKAVVCTWNNARVVKERCVTEDRFSLMSVV